MRPSIADSRKRQGEERREWGNGSFFSSFLRPPVSLHSSNTTPNPKFQPPINSFKDEKAKKALKQIQQQSGVGHHDRPLPNALGSPSSLTPGEATLATRLAFAPGVRFSLNGKSRAALLFNQRSSQSNQRSSQKGSLGPRMKSRISILSQSEQRRKSRRGSGLSFASDGVVEPYDQPEGRGSIRSLGALFVAAHRSAGRGRIEVNHRRTDRPTCVPDHSHQTLPIAMVGALAALSHRDRPR